MFSRAYTASVSALGLNTVEGPAFKLFICSCTEWNGYQLPHPVLMFMSLLVIMGAMSGYGNILIALAKLCLYGTRPSCVMVRYRPSKYLQHNVIASVYAL